MLSHIIVIEPYGYFVSASFLAGIYTKNTVIPVGLLAGICIQNIRSPLTTCGDDKII